MQGVGAGLTQVYIAHAALFGNGGRLVDAYKDHTYIVKFSK